MAYNTDAIRDLVKAILDDRGLTSFCREHFSPVYEMFVPWMSRLWKIQLLIDYCERADRTGELLTRLRRVNSQVYDEFAPRIERPPRPPGIAASPARGRAEVEFQGDFSQSTPEQRSAALAAAVHALASVLDVSSDQLRVVRVRAGSLVVKIEMPADSARRLAALNEAGDSALRDLGVRRVSAPGLADPIGAPAALAGAAAVTANEIPPRRPAVERVRSFWSAFKDIAIVFSFIVNLILVIVLILVLSVFLSQGGTVKAQALNPLLGLDRAFQHLGESSIDTVIPIRQQLPVKFNLPVQFTLPLNQKTTVTTLTPTHISTKVNLSLGPYGNINAPVALDLPAGTPLQVQLSLNIPVSTTVAVDQTIPVNFDQPVSIKLGPSGLNPVVSELRGVLRPYIILIEKLP